MKVFLAGLIGAFVSAGIWFSLEHQAQANLGWLACGVGVITGLCIHFAAGKNSSGNFFRGAMAVVLTLVAIVGGRQVFVKVLEVNAAKPGANAIVDASIPKPQETVEQEGSNANAKATSSQPISDINQKQLATVKVGGPNMSLKSTLSEWDMLWMCLGALAAYVIGKGRDQPIVAETSEEVQSETPPSEQTNEN